MLAKDPIQMYDPRRDYKAHQQEFDAAVSNVLAHGLFIGGPEVKKLEEDLAARVGVANCIAVANGTDALQIALMAYGFGCDDEIITVAHTWISTAEVIALLGAKPVFVDIEEDTFNMDPSALERAITPRTKAIIPVSLYGQMPDYTKINEIAKKHNLAVIEDGAQSFGASCTSGHSCGVTVIGCTSFFPSKPLGCWSDGGALFTNDPVLAEKIRGIRNHGCLERFKHRWIGVNSRLDTLQAAVLGVKLPYFDRTILARQRIAERYNQKLESLSDLLKLPKIAPGNTHVWAQYSLLAKDRETRDLIFNGLKAANINVAIFYPSPLHLQECFQYLGYSAGSLPVTESVCSRILNLPCYAELTENEQVYIIDNVIRLILTRG